MVFARRAATWLCLTSATLLSTAHANPGGGETYYFTGAITVSDGSKDQGTYAVSAQCPADHPVSCTEIQQPYHCCPANNYCTWSSSQVACCPNGATCNGWSSGDDGYAAGGGAWDNQPTTTQQWAPQHTTQQHWTPAPTTQQVGAGGGYIVPAGGYQAQTATQDYNNYGGYCSTLYAHGDNLPTTEVGQCGTILVTEPAEGARFGVGGWGRLVGWVVGLNAIGWALVVRR